MTEQALRAWLTLYFTPRLGGKGLQKLLAKATPNELLGWDGAQLQAAGLSNAQVAFIQQASHDYIEQCLRWRDEAPHHHIITLDDPRYPPLLAQVPVPPPLLFVKGELASLSLPQIAIVGSRHATIDGLQSAKHFARAMAEQGLIVTSGLALGVDGHAHDGALQGGGKTVAVLGCGLNTIYPARHKQLAMRIEQQGALVSEFHPNILPKGANFPRRNRIISGLSLGVLVVEATERSGSLITARYAAEQGRDVFALPGSIHTPQAKGCNQLIRQGAALIQTVDDIVNEIEHLLLWSNNYQARLDVDDVIEKEAKEQLPFADLLANVGKEVTPVDILAQRTNIPVQEVMMQLLELELLGHVVAVSGGYIRKGRG
ncbi:DNA-protecting protein DprA [Vibrio ponticus]|uniref:DNA-protecting protein DprA n=1 Tax=Vibrio ponticus TaxID=265668 RepID=A0A3N3E1Z6_9VIBR|nr:DNA-processing protein DprA [Vibrio ponticus]ROV60528.1 DNA-protecting protein DprA [Vibrio ponticus]